MDVNSIITLSRTLTHTDINQISDTQALEYLNIIYKKMSSAIIMKIDEDYFWDEFITSTVANQSEYVLPIASSTTPWFKKILRVELKYRATDSVRKLVSSDTIANYSQTVDQLVSSANQNNAFYDLKDGSIFVYPEPTETVASGLVIGVVTTLADLVSGWSETTIFPDNSELRDYHDILAIWMKQFIFSQQGLTNEKNDAINEFNNGLNELLDTLKDRYFNPVVTQLPNSYYLTS